MKCADPSIFQNPQRHDEAVLNHTSFSPGSTVLVAFPLETVREEVHVKRVSETIVIIAK